MTALADHLWQSTAFALLAACLVRVLRRERAAIRHAVWMAASIKFLVPYAVLVTVGTAVAPSLPVPSFVFATTGDLPATEPWTEPLRRIVVISTPIASVATRWQLTDVLGTLWLAGFAVFCATWIARWRGVARIVRASVPVTSGRIPDLLDRLRSSDRGCRRLSVVSSPSSINPGVYGFVNPVLIWPDGLTRRLDDDQIEAILRHEIEHVRRHDNLTAAIHSVVQGLFWFHPMVVWIGSRLISERERACDEAVLSAGNRNHVYAESILIACESMARGPASGMASVAGASLRHRIEHVLSGEPGRELRGWRRTLVIAAAVLAVATPIGAGFVVSARTQSVSDAVGSLDLTQPAPENAARWLITLHAPDYQLAIQGFTLRDLIGYAYGSSETPVVQGPQWIDVESVTMAGSISNQREKNIPAEVQRLLEQQLDLVVHREVRELPAYKLVVTPAEPAVRSAQECFDGQAWRAAGSPEEWLPGRGALTRFCGTTDWGVSGLQFTGITMAEMAAQLSPTFVDRRVIDATGLDGRFDVDLAFFAPAVATMRRFPQALGVFETLGFSSFREVLRRQAGLELRETVAPREVLVIDRVNRP